MTFTNDERNELVYELERALDQYTAHRDSCAAWPDTTPDKGHLIQYYTNRMIQVRKLLEKLGVTR